ncbi:MAG: hypothetical protein QXE81_03130 [Desulfurococcaceae archaeon]
MTYYVHVHEDLVRKNCEDGKICFWVKIALLNPSGTGDLYIFDCSISKFLRKEYTDKLDSRLLLSFKSPIGINSIQYGSKMGFQEISNTYPCTIEDIENYISRLLEELEIQLSKTKEEFSKVSKSRWMSRFLFPSRGDYHVLKGVFYGQLMRSKIINDLVTKLGFKEKILYANLTKANILLSLNPRKKIINGLILNKLVKLAVHSKIVDIDALLASFNYIY